MSGDSDSPRRGWSSKRREIVYRELRGVLDTQQTVMDDIDDKALRTVRITALLLGVVVPAAGLAAVSFQPLLAAVGVLALVGSAIVGVLTYGESDLVVGPSGEYAVSLATGESEDWELDFLVELASWTESNAADIAANGRLLFYTQALFVAGLVALTASVAYYPVVTYLGP
jgi:hypothetical protein